MSAEEVDHIMHIMYAAVNNGLPYAEDYYYQVGPGSGSNALKDSSVLEGLKVLGALRWALPLSSP